MSHINFRNANIAKPLVSYLTGGFISIVNIVGLEGGGDWISCVEFKKWSCPLSLSLKNSHVPCQIQEIGMPHVTMIILVLLYH